MTTQPWDVRSEAGFMACYRATFPEVYRYAALLCGSDRLGAEDLVQDVYLAALVGARAGTTTELSTGWLVTAARHRFIDKLRSTQREHRRLQLVANIEATPTVATMPSRLASLPDRERTALVLRFVDDLKVAQIAQSMGISNHACESLIARATKHLRHQEANHA